MASNAKRQMSLVGFMQAGNATVYAGSWRHPATEHGFLDRGLLPEARADPRRGLLRHDVLRRPPGHARHLRRVGRRGGAPRRPPGEARPEHRARHRAPRPPARSGWGRPTRRPTTRRSTSPAPSPRSTTSPAGGPPGTSSRRSTTARPRTSASKEHLGHDARYDRADEFLEATTGLWDTWEDDALVLDRETPASSPTPTRCTSSTTTASGSASRGPLTVPRSPAGPAGAAAGRLVGPGPRLRRPLGRAHLHRRPRHRHRPLALQGPEGADRRARAATRHRSRCCRWPTRWSASPRPTPRSASSSSSTTSSIRWRR